MTADVYAGDNDLNLPRPAGAEVVAIIKVRADADADVLFRIASQLNLLNCLPRRFLLEQLPDNQVAVEVTVCNCTGFAVDMVCRKLDRLTSVIEVACEHA